MTSFDESSIDRLFHIRKGGNSFSEISSSKRFLFWEKIPTHLYNYREIQPGVRAAKSSAPLSTCKRRCLPRSGDLAYREAKRKCQSWEVKVSIRLGSVRNRGVFMPPVVASPGTAQPRGPRGTHLPLRRLSASRRHRHSAQHIAPAQEGEHHVASSAFAAAYTFWH